MLWEASNKHYLRILAQLRLQPPVPLLDLQMARPSRVVAQRLCWLLLVSQAKPNLSTPHHSQRMPNPTNSSLRLLDERPLPSPHTKHPHPSTRSPYHNKATTVHRSIILSRLPHRHIDLLHIYIRHTQTNHRQTASIQTVPHRIWATKVIRLHRRRVATRVQRRRTIASALLRSILFPILGRLAMVVTTLHQPTALERLWARILETFPLTEVLRKTPSKQNPGRLLQGSLATMEITRSERLMRTKACSASVASQRSPSIPPTSKNLIKAYEILITNNI